VPVSRWWCELAWLGDGAEAAVERVLVTVDGEVVTSVEPGIDAPADAVRLRGLTLPGLANAHSHAFHRALRGRTHSGAGDFWAWRERMYAVAAWLEPESYHRLARATYAEMALAGITAVGEFHYLHHAPGGVPYADPHAMSDAVVAAAREAGIRMTLLDTCYLQADVDGSPLAGAQLRYGDADVDRWGARAADYSPGPDVVVGAAAHSVRGVPAQALPVVAAWAAERSAPLHIHLSEQRRENEACLAVTGRTPTALLADAGVLGPRATAIHATHLGDDDVAALGGSRTAVCMCPTTERDLADGIGPAARLAATGSPLCLGSDSHAVIDLLEEARGVEYAERLGRQARGHLTAGALLEAATTAGHTSLGWPDAGKIAPGAWADLVTVSLESVRTAGTTDRSALEAAVFAATAADITDVVISGRDVVRDRTHLLVLDVPGELSEAIRAVAS
jgi:formiminoglutamate deiminase